MIPISDRSDYLHERLSRYRHRLAEPVPLMASGRLTRMVGLTMEVMGCEVPVGGRCTVIGQHGKPVEAEVVGFARDRLYLMPLDHIHGVVPGARVIPQTEVYQVQVGNDMLGRVIDGSGQPLDGKGPIETSGLMPLMGDEINPLSRPPVEEPLDVGIRSINSLLTIGKGQRMGLFAGSGVGKSVLLSMMTRYTEADVTVVGLIGERGREVNEFIQRNLGEEGLKRSVVVASPADTSPLMRLHAAWLAAAVAEYFAAQGKKVLLLMDSLTRFAQAQREISLAVGEPPATKGYTPSVFAKLPRLVERAGTHKSGGSVTAIYTVLAEGDDQQDPIVDASRAILDGHIVLNRRIAETGLYPAIDIEASVSRVMVDIVDETHMQKARKIQSLYSYYQQNRDLISVGAYQHGSDPRLDEAIRMHPAILDFLGQSISESVDYQQSLSALDEFFPRPNR